MPAESIPERNPKWRRDRRMKELPFALDEFLRATSGANLTAVGQKGVVRTLEVDSSKKRGRPQAVMVIL